MKRDEWMRFCEEGLVYGGDMNTTLEFPKMTKSFGRPYIEYLEIAYEARDEMSDEEFCRLNGNVPAKFLSRFTRV